MISNEKRARQVAGQAIMTVHLKPLWLRHCVRAIVAIRLLCVPATCQTPEVKSVVVRYLQAAQKHDHAALMRLSFAYQAQILQMTSESPKILLSKRLVGLHDSTLSCRIGRKSIASCGR